MDGLIPESNPAAEAHVLQLLFSKKPKKTTTAISSETTLKENDAKSKSAKRKKNKPEVGAEEDRMHGADQHGEKDQNAFLIRDSTKNVATSAPGFVIGSASKSVNSTQLENEFTRAKKSATSKSRRRNHREPSSSSSSSSEASESSEQASEDDSKSAPVAKRGASPTATLSQKAAESLTIKTNKTNKGGAGKLKPSFRILEGFMCDSDDDESEKKLPDDEIESKSSSSRKNKKTSLPVTSIAASKTTGFRFAPIVASDSDEDSDDDPFSALEAPSKVFKSQINNDKHTKKSTSRRADKPKSNSSKNAGRFSHASDESDDAESDDNVAALSANVMLATGRRIGGYGKEENLISSRSAQKALDTSSGSGRIMQSAKRQLGMMRNPTNNKTLTPSQWNQLSLEQRRMALLNKEVASEAASKQPANNSNGLTYFSASYAKKSERKHKVFEKDGFTRLMAAKGSIMLLDCSGQRVDNRGGVPHAVLNNLEGGETIVIGGYDVQLVDALSAAEFEKMKQVGKGSLDPDQNGADVGGEAKKFKW